MYLTGNKTFRPDFSKPEGEQLEKEDGFELSSKTLKLGYWRKHPDLHGFIVQTFADGEDDCQEINLDTTEITEIIEAIKAKKLPKTSGFFFGESDGSEDLESIEIFEKALAWMNSAPSGEWRTVTYQASW